jgi:hypothetical protein
MRCSLFWLIAIGLIVLSLTVQCRETHPPQQNNVQALGLPLSRLFPHGISPGSLVVAITGLVFGIFLGLSVSLLMFLEGNYIWGAVCLVSTLLVSVIVSLCCVKC